MWKGYMLMNIRPGTHSRVAAHVTALKEKYKAIKEVDVVYGTTDLVVVLQAESEEEFLDTLNMVATCDPEITGTSTFPVASKDVLEKVSSES